MDTWKIIWGEDGYAYVEDQFDRPIGDFYAFHMTKEEGAEKARNDFDLIGDPIHIGGLVPEN